MKQHGESEHGALQMRMRDVQENLLEFFSASAMAGTMGWEEIHIQPPETNSPPSQQPILRRVA